jgi:hypothetical protein
MDSTTLALLSVILTGVYVLLTLVIVIFTALANKTTRDALKANEKQAKEALLNQQKPVIVPISELVVYHETDFRIDIQNKGTGIAMNAWGIIFNITKEQFFRFKSSYFLVPDKTESIALIDISIALDFLFPTRKFHGYSIFSENDTGKLGTVNRLMITYNDVFDNKYLVIFDWSQQLGWRQFEGIKSINQRLDEYFVEKRANAHLE